MHKRGLLSFHGKIETIALDFPGEKDSFPILTLLFHLSLLKLWLSHPSKNYIFEMSKIAELFTGKLSY